MCSSDLLVLEAQRDLGPAPSYGFALDSSGRTMTKRLRRTYRKELIEHGVDGLPSPFLEAHRHEFRRWRTRSLPRQASNALSDSSLAFKYAFPDTFARIKRTAPAQFRWVRGRLLAGSKIRR